MSNKIARRTQLQNEQKSQLVAQLMSIERTSILPPPDELERYEKLRPGTTDILLTTFQNQSKHRMELEKTVIESGAKNARRGQTYAFVLAFVTILGGFACIFLDKDVLGISAVVSALIALVGVFITGTRSKKDERIQKEKLNQ